LLANTAPESISFSRHLESSAKKGFAHGRPDNQSAIWTLLNFWKSQSFGADDEDEDEDGFEDDGDEERPSSFSFPFDVLA
jgi:hypothetical protein